MTAIAFTVETLTPLFLGGADQRADVELRPASVRGALRFWYRALWAGVYGDDVRALQSAEGKLFGDTDAASRIVVRLSGSLRPEPLKIKPPAREDEPGGAAYMLWSMLRLQRQAIPAGKTFTMEIQARRRPTNAEADGEDDRAAVRQTLATLWLLTHLGGLGARARRGGGNLAIHPHNPSAPLDPLLEELPSLEIQARTLDELQGELADGLRKCRQMLDKDGWYDERQLTPLPTFDILHPKTCDIRIWNKGPWPNWEAALEAVGQAFKSFRNRRQPDYDNVKGAVSMKSKSLKPVRRAAFGLPIVFYYKSLGGARGTLEGESHDRRSSPLSFRLIRLANQQFAVVLLTFRSRFLSEVTHNGRFRPERLKLRHDSDVLYSDPPDLSLIDEFIASLGKTLEVDYR